MIFDQAGKNVYSLWVISERMGWSKSSLLFFPAFYIYKKVKFLRWEHETIPQHEQETYKLMREERFGAMD